MLIRVKKGHNLNIAGQPGSDIEVLGKPDRVAVLPEHIPFIKPRLLISKWNRVKIGTPLFQDKRNPDILFLSPGSGVIESIKYGKRRVIKEIVIGLDENEKEESFQSLNASEVASVPRDKLVNLLIKGGGWPHIRSLPFRDIADPETMPPSVIVSLESLDSFMPSSEFYLAENEELFLFGLNILQRLSETVFVSSLKNLKLPDALKKTVTHTVSGKYPADDPGVMLYHIKKTPAENNAWYINGQDVLFIASLIKNGRYPVEKIYSVAGTGAPVKRFIKARIGAPVSQLDGQQDQSSVKLRYVAGGTLRGYALPRNSYMGLYESSLNIMPEGDEEEFFGFVRPGFKRQSYSRTFLSFFNKSTIDMSCNMHGELRACINCSTCETVCQVNIYPQFAFKCIEAGETEEALAHGLLDCVECGLCTYVCPSKIDLNQKFKDAKAAYYKEQA